MFDIKFGIFLMFVELVLIFAGILFWFSDSFAHALGILGFFTRFFAGLVTIIIGVLLFIFTVKSNSGGSIV